MGAYSGGGKKKVEALADTVTFFAAGPCVVTAIRGLGATAASYIQVFDVAAAADVTLGTTVADWLVKSEAGDPSLGDGLPTDGAEFDKGVFAACTTDKDGLTASAQTVVMTIR